MINDTRYGVGNDFQGQNATYVSSDLVEEVQVVTAAADAEAAGGSAQVRLQTRSGANQFHGALFLANNNSALNANDWFNNQKGAPKSYVNQNQYGGRLSGPIIKNKAFFFVLIDNQNVLYALSLIAGCAFSAPTMNSGETNASAMSPGDCRF